MILTQFINDMTDLEYNRRHPQKDIPADVWMKHLLKAYRKEHEELEFLRPYCKGLEEENVMLKKQLDEIKRPSEDLIEENKKLKNYLKANQGLIEKMYPRKLRRTRYLRSLNQNYQHYYMALQEILDSNGIEYPPRPILRENPLEGVDLDELMKSTEEAIEQYKREKENESEQMK